MKAQIKITELELFDNQQYAIVNVNGTDYTFDIDVDWKIEFIKDWCSTDRGDIDMSSFEITAKIDWKQFVLGENMEMEEGYDYCFQSFDEDTAKQICELVKDSIEDTNDEGEKILIEEGHIDNW
jgi:hypothetical protein